MRPNPEILDENHKNHREITLNNNYSIMRHMQ